MGRGFVILTLSELYMVCITVSTDWVNLFRIFLVLFAGGAVQQLPKGLGTGVGESGKPGQISFAHKR